MTTNRVLRNNLNQGFISYPINYGNKYRRIFKKQYISDLFHSLMVRGENQKKGLSALFRRSYCRGLVERYYFLMTIDFVKVMISFLGFLHR